MTEEKRVDSYKGFDIFYYPYDKNRVSFWNDTSAAFPSAYQRNGYKVVVYFDETNEVADRWIEKTKDKTVMLARMKGAIRELKHEIDQYIVDRERYHFEHATDDELFVVAVKQSRERVPATGSRRR